MDDNDSMSTIEAMVAYMGTTRQKVVEEMIAKVDAGTAQEEKVVTRI